MEDRAIEFTGLNLVAQDIGATAAFYRLLGITIPEESVWQTGSGPHHVGDIEAGGSGILELDSHALASAYNEGFVKQAVSTVIGFRLPSREAVDEMHARVVAAGHVSRQVPYDTFWGARYAIVADPDGRDIGLMSPSDPARRQAPPDL